MPHDAVLGSIYTALKTIMAAYAPLTALLGKKPLDASAAGIYDEGSVPQGLSMSSSPAGLPYITIGAGTQVPDHAMGEDGLARYGWSCTLQIKVVGRGSEASGLAIMSQVMAVLREGTPLTLAGYTRAWCDEFTLFPTIITTAAAEVTREWPAILRVFASDT